MARGPHPRGRPGVGPRGAPRIHPPRRGHRRRRHLARADPGRERRARRAAREQLPLGRHPPRAHHRAVRLRPRRPRRRGVHRPRAAAPGGLRAAPAPPLPPHDGAPAGGPAGRVAVAAPSALASTAPRSTTAWSRRPTYDASRRYGMVLSLHGAGVEGIGQARAYSPKADLVDRRPHQPPPLRLRLGGQWGPPRRRWRSSTTRPRYRASTRRACTSRATPWAATAPGSSGRSSPGASPRSVPSRAGGRSVVHGPRRAPRGLRALAGVEQHAALPLQPRPPRHLRHPRHRRRQRPHPRGPHRGRARCSPAAT
jgi:hypothetical protein